MVQRTSEPEAKATGQGERPVAYTSGSDLDHGLNVTRKRRRGKTKKVKRERKSLFHLCFGLSLVAYFLASSASITLVTSAESGLTLDGNRATTWPSRLTTNFSKFHLMSPANLGFVSFEVRY